MQKCALEDVDLFTLRKSTKHKIRRGAPKLIQTKLIHMTVQNQEMLDVSRMMNRAVDGFIITEKALQN